MSSGSTNGTTDAAVDPVLSSAMAELATEGVNMDDPANGPSSQDSGAVPSAPVAPVAAPPADAGDARPDGSPPGAASLAPGDPASAPTDPPAASDPLAGTEPFTYTTDGVTKTLDGVYRVPGEGLIVPEEKVGDFQRIASRADHLERVTRTLQDEAQTWERLTQWTTRGPDGTEQTLTGRAGYEAQRVLLGSALASIETLTKAFHGSPLDYITQDAQGNIVWNPQALAHLATQAELAEMRAGAEIKARMHTAVQTVTQDLQTQQVQAEAPTILWRQAESVWGREFPQLTASDKQFLQAQLPRFIRPASAEEVRSGQFQAGEPVLDYDFRALMADKAQTRAELSKVAATSTTAATFNAAQQRGRAKAPPAAPAPVSSASTTAARPPREDLWDRTLTEALQELAV